MEIHIFVNINIVVSVLVFSQSRTDERERSQVIPKKDNYITMNKEQIHFQEFLYSLLLM